MKKLIILLAAVLCSSVSLASYTYTITEYQSLPSLDGTETLLMTGEGGTNSLDLYDFSSATIQGTSSLLRGSGGIWELRLFDSTHLDFSGGNINELRIRTDATAILSGGRINTISSNQIAWKLDYGFDPPQWVPNPHITIIYSGDLPAVDAGNVLTGLWGDGSNFSIQLVDVSGYSPAIENVQFELIPEPATLLLLGAGGLLLRKRTS